jgi:hypothetical protein
LLVKKQTRTGGCDSRANGTNHVEDLEQHGLSDGVVEFTDIEGSTGTLGSGLTRGRGGGGLSLRLGRSLRRGLLGRARGDGGGSCFVRHFDNFEVVLEICLYSYSVLLLLLLYGIVHVRVIVINYVGFEGYVVVLCRKWGKVEVS